jgi:XTP/dITP diphosphohydrolase
MQVVLASGNAHKAKEISAALPRNLELILQSDLEIVSAEETGLTFLENALIKARNAAACSNLPALADDSGISVDALGGAPGIYSARYAGVDASDRQNLEKLLTELGDHDNRKARFHCVLVFLRTPDDPTPLVAEGSWHGQIAHSASGEAGFGYDPVFYLPDRACTAAELNMTEKNEISHRGIALRQMTKLLRERYPA